MREQRQREDVDPPARRTNTVIILLASAVVMLLVLRVYFASRGNPDQDKLTSRSIATELPGRSNGEKICASSSTYGIIKRELFQRAAQLRGSDQGAFDRLSGAAVVRMVNPVMESQDNSTGAVSCSGSLAVDLPPGVQVVGGRHTLTADVDYTVTTASDRSGPVVLLKNADAIVTPLATLAAVNPPAPAQAQAGAESNNVAQESAVIAPQPTRPAVQPPRNAPAAPPRSPTSERPSFNCSGARTRGEIAVCSQADLAALDREMATAYRRAISIASPEQRDILKQTAYRFYAYRDRCPTSACIGDAYTGRLREISDIMSGRWQPSQ